MFFFDYILVFLALACALLFLWRGEGKLYKLYLGCIIGFLIFLVLSLQIELIEKVYLREELTFLQDFLLKNKSLILHIALFSIIIFSLLLAFNDVIEIHGDNSLFWVLLFGTAFPFFFFGILSYIAENADFPFSFLDSLFSLIGKSSFLSFISKNPEWLFLWLLWLLFYKFFWNLIVSLWILIWNWFAGLIFWEADEAEVEHHEEVEEEKKPRRKRHFHE